jgi:hypothetical protein
MKSQKRIIQGITMNVQNYHPEPPSTAENTKLRSPHLLIALYVAAVSKMRWQTAPFIYTFFYNCIYVLWLTATSRIRVLINSQHLVTCVCEFGIPETWPLIS